VIHCFVLDWSEVPIRVGAHDVKSLCRALENQNAAQTLTRIAGVSVVECEQVKSAHAKLGARAKKRRNWR